MPWTEFNHDLIPDPYDPNIAYTIDDGEEYPTLALGNRIMEINFEE